MKKRMSILLSLVLALSLCACSAGSLYGMEEVFDGASDSMLQAIMEDGLGISAGEWECIGVDVTGFSMYRQVPDPGEEVEEGLLSGEFSSYFNDDGTMVILVEDVYFVIWEEGYLVHISLDALYLTFQEAYASPVGTWTLAALLTGGEEYDADALMEMGLEAYIIMDEDGTGYVYLLDQGAVMESWELQEDLLYLTVEGDTAVMQYTGDLILWYADDGTLIFAREQADNSMEAFLGDWTCVALFEDGEINTAGLEEMGDWTLSFSADGTGMVFSGSEGQEFTWFQDGESLYLVNNYGDTLEVAFVGGVLFAYTDDDSALLFVRSDTGSAGDVGRYEEGPAGEWAAIGMDMMGMSLKGGDLAMFGIDMELILWEDGTGYLWAYEDGVEFIWSFLDGVVILDVDGELTELSFTEEDLLILSQGGDTPEESVSIIFARIGSDAYYEAMAMSSLADLLAALTQ